MKISSGRKPNIYLIAILAIFTCGGISFLSSRILVDSRIIRPNRFIDGFISPSEWIANWLKNPTCKVPCWENIVPGDTNRDQAKSLLSNNTDVTSFEESNVIPYGQVLKINLDNDVYPDDATILFDNQNIVQEINLGTFGDNLYLHDVISVYGPPRRVLFHDQMYEYVTVDLLYPELGMAIELFLPNLNLEGEIPQVKIEKYGEILHVYLEAPDLKYYFEISEITDGTIDPRLLSEWKGYTIYP